jgi:UDP-glucose:(heptosyl)LPS alpha-1,3-glucosyltransferase
MVRRRKKRRCSKLTNSSQRNEFTDTNGGAFPEKPAVRRVGTRANMKLALIRRQFSATGGAELYLQRLMDALTQRGHEPHLFAEGWRQPPSGASFHSISVTGSPALRPLRFAEAVKDAVAKERFDCVFSLERTLRQDVYRAGDGLHRVWLERRREFAPWWGRPFTGGGAFHRNMMRLEDRTFDPANTGRIIVNSNMVKREILENYNYPEERIHLVRNGVEVDRFHDGKRAETRKRFGVEDDDILLLFVGSGWERKGLRYLIKAAAGLEGMQRDNKLGELSREMVEGADELPNVPRKRVRLLVVGKGRKPAGAGDSIIFAGPMNDVENAYAAADLFVFPPIYEPCSNVVFEALAAGLPVITTRQNGASELIREDVNGSVLEDPSDIGGLIFSICHWASRRMTIPRIDTAELELERNVEETMKILELAAAKDRVRA